MTKHLANKWSESKYFGLSVFEYCPGRKLQKIKSIVFCRSKVAVALGKDTLDVLVRVGASVVCQDITAQDKCPGLAARFDIGNQPPALAAQQKESRRAVILCLPSHLVARCLHRSQYNASADVGV